MRDQAPSPLRPPPPPFDVAVSNTPVELSLPPPPALLPVDAPVKSEHPQPSSVSLSTDVICDNCHTAGHWKRNCPQIKCSICRNLGHFSSDCPQTSAKRQRLADDAALEEDHRDAVCLSCGSSRHMRANCPVRFQALECFKCHRVGHLMTTCPLTRCFNCGTFGHSSQICHSKPQCFHCANAGHRSSECPEKFKGRVCYQCNAPGHEAASCPLGQRCRMCHQTGHIVANCPGVVCNQCHQKGHTAGSCPNVHCENCGRTHKTSHCPQPYASVPHHDRVSDNGEDSRCSTPGKDETPPPLGRATEEEQPMVATMAVSVASIPPYLPSTTVSRDGRVAIVIDGSYFERCVGVKRNRCGIEYYQAVAHALRHTLNFLGDLFQREPYAFWYDTDTTAFTEFLETSMPLAHRQQAFKEAAMRKQHLTDEMNGGRSLNTVVAKLVGGMKRQRGYTEDGPGFVWVQTGVDVAIATCVIELFHDRRQFGQVVLLCGDADVYPAIQYCNSLRKTSPLHADANPVRVCGTSTSMSKLYGQQQDLSDFLPRVLLDQASHTEGKLTLEFPTHKIFERS